MIAIKCTNCRQRLEMDEAFAGGVCRCQYCGTIQTVPARGSSAGRPSTPGSGSTTAKPLYRKEEATSSSSSSSTAGRSAGSSSSSRGTRRPNAAGTGLDELAQVVASSGLARGSLTKKPPAATPPKTPEATEAAGGGGRFPVMPIVIGSAVAAVIIIGTLIYVALRPPAPTNSSSPSTAGGGGGTPATVSPPPTTPGDSNTTEQPATPKIAGPAFADVPLPSGTVVYVVDRSQANDEILDALKQVVYKSARSLGPSRAFQIIFWQRTNEGIVAYPDKSVALASPKEVDAAVKRFEDVVSYGTTELKPTLEKALKANPRVIIIATAKGFSLEEGNVAMVKSLVKDKPVQIHTFAIGEGDSATLKQIASQNNGEYRQITPDQLKAMAK